MLQLGGGKTKTSKNFEIKLDNPFVVFHGDAHEAEPVELAGTLHLNTADSMNVRSIKIRLEGKWKVSWLVEPGVSTMQIREKGTVISEECTLYPVEGAGSNVTHKISPGEHSWRFKFELDPALPESVEGLAGSFIVYDLKAEIDRGYMSKTLLAEKHVRIVRTLGRDMTESVPLPYSNEDTWRDKLWYHIYIPTRYHIFGTSITVEFILCPLLKGLEIGKIKMEILERVQLKSEAGRFREHSKDVVVASHEQEMPENILPERVEETTGIPDQSHHFKVTLPLPKSLNKMRQSVDTEHVKIFHNLKVYVNLKNPDDHVSQLLVRNLLHIFISPNLPVGEDQTIQANAVQLAQVSQDNESGQSDAPPTYERHMLDQLYDGIDPQGFMSGVNTPYNALSRRGSQEENLHSMLLDSTTLNNTWRNSQTPTTNGGESSTPSALQLQNRLAELQLDNNHDEDFRHPTPHSSPRLAVRSPRAVSFRGSYHQSLHPASAMTGTTVVGSDSEYDMNALSRIPSYYTAVRTPVVTPPATGYDLPTYEIAVSQPSSPWHSPNQLAMQPPPRAHTRAASFDRGNPDRTGSLSSSDSGSLKNFVLSSQEGRRASAAGLMERPEHSHTARRSMGRVAS